MTVGIGLTVWFCLSGGAQHLPERRRAPEGLLQLGRDLGQLGQHPQGLLAEHQAVHGRRGARAASGRCSSRSSAGCPAARRRRSASSPSRTSTSSARCRPSSSSTSSCSACRSPACRSCESSPEFWLCVIALTLVYGAYVAEVYRAGIESIHWSQTAGARSLGLSYARDDAVRRRPAGGAPHHPSAAQRLHRPAEGHRARRLRRRCSTRSTGPASSRRTGSTSRRSPAWRSAYIVITIPLAVVVDHLVRRDQQKMRANQ